MNLAKIKQIKNINIRFTIFTAISKHEKHIIDNRAKIPENFNESLRSLVKVLR